MADMQLARMVVHQRQHKHQLQIGNGDVRVGFKKGTGRGNGAGDHSRTAAAPLPHGGQGFEHAAWHGAKGGGVAGHAPALYIVNVVLQVFTHTRQVMPCLNAMGRQLGRCTNARELQ